MKKTLLSLFVFMGWANQSNAQIYYSRFLCQDCYGNIEVGANLPMFSGIDNAKPKVGYSVAASSYKEINENIFLKFGPAFSQFKVGFDDANIEDLTIYTVTGNVGVHYIEKRDYQFFGGVNIEGNLTKDRMSYSDANNEIEFLTYSLYAGGGLILAKRLELNAKYNLGLTSINSNPEQKWKRNYVSLSLGYTFL